MAQPRKGTPLRSLMGYTQPIALVNDAELRITTRNPLRTSGSLPERPNAITRRSPLQSAPLNDNQQPEPFE